MISIKFLPQAIEELDNSIQYYEELYKSLGLDFHKEVKKTIKIIALNPTIWKLYEDGTRRISTSRFPFKVVYLIENDALWIVAIAHHKRFPEYWSNRLK
ncbi:type II toxin-antitoxin system RelE/ParE family toxin [Lentisphaera marina]|uniref:type II toxin-antitoxin system RelE/ParE family toxin n=1 Tax=Lentisphaera marina TaxID=1111041 RepID=UPI0023658DAD|nr:type II toxin-antitoxin system RelE/ParE family toxin [Lentisphaera marina]MDD7984260.1 type II toxin-antitoxin system RelE/ParE family toxin [Lentisphaera marina]MDD7984782.1 type II toxin-antitoxin system RelE/ParE family toxin [Lentisphaera marina]